MDKTIRLKVINNGLHQRCIFEIIQIPRIGQFIQIADVVVGLSELLKEEFKTDESCATCYD